MEYAVSVSGKALRTIRGWPKPLFEQVEEAIDELKTNPYAGKRLKGKFQGFRRVKVKGARIIYTVSEPERSLKVTGIKPRASAYRKR